MNFDINVATGQLLTKVALDKEDRKLHRYGYSY